MFAVSAAVLAGSLAVAALATHHVITTGVFAARLAVTASTSHVITAGLAAGAAALAVCTARVAAGCTAGLAFSATGCTTGLAFSLAGSTAALASTTDSGHVRFRGVGSGVHLYIRS